MIPGRQQRELRGLDTYLGTVHVPDIYVHTVDGGLLKNSTYLHQARIVPSTWRMIKPFPPSSNALPTPWSWCGFNNNPGWKLHVYVHDSQCDQNDATAAPHQPHVQL
jgi:hypothetical protein